MPHARLVVGVVVLVLVLVAMYRLIDHSIIIITTLNRTMTAPRPRETGRLGSIPNEVRLRPPAGGRQAALLLTWSMMLLVALVVLLVLVPVSVLVLVLVQ